jgi:hypothetical protein
LVYLSVIQFVDLATDAKLFFDMYRYSRIKYTPCLPNRIDYIEANLTCSIIPEYEIFPNGTITPPGANGIVNLADLEFNYTDENETSYKIATTAMLISMVSTYLVAYSSIIKLFLDNGSYEPHVIR